MIRDLMVSVIAPVYNEEAVIISFLEKTENVLKQYFANYELILIDDGSTDRTLELCKAYINNTTNIRMVVFSRNYGHEIALTAGIEHAKGDYVVQLDSDLQHPPELIPDLITKAIEGHDIVYAARINRHDQSWLKKITARSFYKVARKMTGFDIPEDAGNFRVISRNVVRSIKRLKESNRHLLMLYAYIGFKPASIPYECEPRYAGDSKYNYRKLINLALDSIISFSNRPLRYMAILCVFVSVIMSCFAAFILLQNILYFQEFANGITTIILITSGLFSILFLFLAIISEYIGRILIESKNRPLYYVKEEYENTHTTADINSL